jgi:tellurite resistance protein TehA-like permease
MYSIRKLITGILLAGIISTLFNSSAYAYIDTSTGSYIIQMVLAGLMGIILTLKIFWKQVKSFFARGKSGQKEAEDKTD